MKVYIATFYSHYGAIRFKKGCSKLGLSARQMPVPRTLSSSCGTCVRYEAEAWDVVAFNKEEVEQIVAVLADGYDCLYKAENS